MFEPDALNSALHAHRSAILALNDLIEPVRFVTGRAVLAFPIVMKLDDVDSQSALDATLHIPDEGESALQIHIQLAPIRDASPLQSLLDRWQAYHGRAPSPRFFAATALGARQGSSIITGNLLELTNPLAPGESRLLKILNADPLVLKKLSTILLRHEVHDPVAVGLDPRGVHLRTRTGILRLPFTHPAPDEPAATTTIAHLLALA